MNEFLSCVCHKGITWEKKDLTDEGHCPQYFWEQNDSEFLSLQERQAAYDEEWGL